MSICQEQKKNNNSNKTKNKAKKNTPKHEKQNKTKNNTNNNKKQLKVEIISTLIQMSIPGVQRQSGRSSDRSELLTDFSYCYSAGKLQDPRHRNILLLYIDTRRPQMTRCS